MFGGCRGSIDTLAHARANHHYHVKHTCRQLLSLPDCSAYRLQAHKRARLGVAAVAAAAGEREDMKVFKNTGRHMGARKPSRLPQGISKIAV